MLSHLKILIFILFEISYLCLTLLLLTPLFGAGEGMEKRPGIAGAEFGTGVLLLDLSLKLKNNTVNRE